MPASEFLLFSLSGIANWSSFGVNWLTWWLGDLIGILVVTPLILSLVKPFDILTRPVRAVEITVLLISLIGVTGFVFFGPLKPELHPLLLP